MRYQRHLLLAAWMPPVKIQSPSSPKPADVSPPTWRLSQKIGQLPWPTVGTLFSFSSPKKLTGLRFRAPPGTPVRAIAPGTVVYSGPLAGYGPVVIIDHYDGYHTVMAGIRPQKIKVGRVVDPGTQIATIAMPNDHTHPGLYFEIRKEGMLTNAKRFLRSKSS
jgi:septal ring factor EnvC (AmiA/AmiB activator)